MLAIERIYILDIFTAFLQVVIIACSMYIIKSSHKIVLKY